MNPAETIRGRAVVVQPGEGPSYWQPVPANGHADPVLFPGRTGFDGVSMGFQTVAPGGLVHVSYNALPGLAGVLPLRELMRSASDLSEQLGARNV